MRYHMNVAETPKEYAVSANKTLSKRRRIGKVLLILALIIALFPVPMACGAPGATCMPAPDDDGYVEIYYEIEPLAVALLEQQLWVNLPAYFAFFRRERVIFPNPQPTP